MMLFPRICNNTQRCIADVEDYQRAIVDHIHGGLF